MKLRKNRILTDALREIRNTFSRFVSLLVLSALAVCFLAGLRATAPDMKKSADLYFDQQQLMDLHVLSTLGLTEADAAALAEQPGVAAVEQAYTVDAVIPLPENEYIVKVLSFTEDPGLNAPRLVEGRLPQAPDECLAEPLLLEGDRSSRGRHHRAGHRHGRLRGCSAVRPLHHCGRRRLPAVHRHGPGLLLPGHRQGVRLRAAAAGRLRYGGIHGFLHPSGGGRGPSLL